MIWPGPLTGDSSTACAAEIGDLHGDFGGDQQIGRLDVAMHDPGIVDGLQRLRDLTDDARAYGCRPPAPAPQARRPASARRPAPSRGTAPRRPRCSRTPARRRDGEHALPPAPPGGTSPGTARRPNRPHAAVSPPPAGRAGCPPTATPRPSRRCRHAGRADSDPPPGPPPSRLSLPARATPFSEASPSLWGFPPTGRVKPHSSNLPLSLIGRSIVVPPNRPVVHADASKPRMPSTATVNGSAEPAARAST